MVVQPTETSDSTSKNSCFLSSKNGDSISIFMSEKPQKMSENPEKMKANPI